VANEVCEDLISATNAEGVDISAKTLTQGQLCAGGDSGKGVCNGDSGGPLLVQKNDNLLYLAGLASWVQGCAQPNLPAVFTRIPAYANALNAVMDGKSSTLNAEPDATAVLPDSGETDTPDSTGAGTETTTTGGGGGATLPIAWLGLVLLRRRRG